MRSRTPFANAEIELILAHTNSSPDLNRDTQALLSENKMAAGIAFPGFITTCKPLLHNPLEHLVTAKPPVIAFTLLLLNSISTPIFKQLYFLRVYLTDPGAAKLSPSALLLGTLGYCVSGDASSVFSPFHDGTNASGCTPAKVGYKLDYRLFVDGEVWGISMDGMSKVVVKGLTYLLFLQPFGESDS